MEVLGRSLVLGNSKQSCGGLPLPSSELSSIFSLILVPRKEKRKRTAEINIEEKRTKVLDL